jgi:Domain of unknown function (DUF4336)
MSLSSQDKGSAGRLSRRQLGELTVAAGLREERSTDYALWDILPICRYKLKPTVLETIAPDMIWTLEQ